MSAMPSLVVVSELPTTQFLANNTLGALLIGLLVSCSLFGVATVQVYIYYKNFRNDKLFLKVIVMLVCVNGYADPTLLLDLPRTLDVTILLSGLLGSSVQGFFLGRSYLVSRKLLVPIVGGIMALARFCFATVLFADGLKLRSIPKVAFDLKWLLLLSLSFGTALDLVIGVTLSYSFKNIQSSYTKTSYVLNKISAWTIQTGLVTGISGLLVIICYLTEPSNFIWISIYILMARIYSNTLLASLNGRIMLRTSPPRFGLPGPAVIEALEMQTADVQHGDHSPRLFIHVSTVTETKFDSEYEHGVI